MSKKLSTGTFNTMKTPLTFEQMIQQLKLFWQNHGCLLIEPTDIEVGAGTFHPATFLECLGPNPSNVAYVQKCRRPADGRYGKNPNRYQLFHQFQVILKPSPVNIQELYLQSLEFIGFDLKKHDMRFVHDDWESPTLGASGLGWEVWMDGMEVTQFTYFQNVGGQQLKPITGEITYGLERIALFLQDKNSFTELLWNPTTTYESLFHRSEVEWSHYHLDEAPIETWQQHFDDYEKQSKELLQKNLLLPAFEFVTKASHAFNVLDARNAISVSSRTNYINRIRSLACNIAKTYVDEFDTTQATQAPHGNSIRSVIGIDTSKLSSHEDFLFEIGTEEIPAAFMLRATESFKSIVQKHFDKLSKLYPDHNLYDSIEYYATPRRLALLIKKLSVVLPEIFEEKRGPKVSQLFDDKGQPTKQALAFFKSQNITPCLEEELNQHPQLKIESFKNHDYLVVVSTQSEESITTSLQSLCDELIKKLSFPKTMRWSDYSLEFARPIRWLTSLLGNQTFNYQQQHLVADLFTFGHRQLTQSASSYPHLGAIVQLEHANEYIIKLKQNHVIACPNERRAMIAHLIDSIEQSHQSICLDKDSSLLDEVNYLVEYPHALFCNYDASYLQAPQQILTSEMKKHQRYFPLFSKDKKIINSCIVITDNTPSKLIEAGNMRVLSARLEDGVFLFNNDCMRDTEYREHLLDQIEYLPLFGTMKDKTERLINISKIISEHIQELSLDQKAILNIAKLSKNDLASGSVCEFPDLQGIIGKEIALRQGYSKLVAEGIEQHWLPNSEKGPIPSSKEAAIVSLADKLDTLICCFGSDLKPTSSSDPFALRRHSIGIIRVLNHHQWHINIANLLNVVLKDYPQITNSADSIAQEIVLYISERLGGLLKKEGISKSILRAVISTDRAIPSLAYTKSLAIDNLLKNSEDAESLLIEVYKRSRGQINAFIQSEGKDLLSNLKDYEKAYQQIHAKQLNADQECALYKAIGDTLPKYSIALDSFEFTKAFTLLAKLQPAIQSFFDHVKVLDEDPAIRINRIHLLVVITAMFDRMMHFESIYS